MQNVIRKVYLSVMISIFCMITLVTATFAWVGFLDDSSFEKFEINLNGSELEEYGIEISLTGENGTFGSSVDMVELKKIILKNTGLKNVDYMTKIDVEKTFNKLTLDQCSVIPNADKTFPEFRDADNKVTKKYFKFDIYLSPFRAFDNDETSGNEYLLNAYLKGELLEGTKDTRNLINKFTYPSYFINNSKNALKGNDEVYKNVTVDSSSACRVAIQKYKIVDKYNKDAYADNSIVQDLIIFQGGTSTPTYNETTGVYSFGGIISDDCNLALYDYNMKYPNDKKRIPTELFSRGDIEYTPNYQIVDSSMEKIGINQMIKMTVYFWFEGWDADCFDVIDRNPVTLNLNFSTTNN